ncbi:hypothetical protein JKP88DRAFT_327422 [Tribonema minus]|uniref:Uncharacterized protein n=1 Tax=Tribonema minus TaxID=303371 RepID=A0A835YPL8_9STRA|nr:hypothetical protein JKP88DRAFT_327422 [Tribonema minus]
MAGPRLACFRSRVEPRLGGIHFRNRSWPLLPFTVHVDFSDRLEHGLTVLAAAAATAAQSIAGGNAASILPYTILGQPPDTLSRFISFMLLQVALRRLTVPVSQRGGTPSGSTEAQIKTFRSVFWEALHLDATPQELQDFEDSLYAAAHLGRMPPRPAWRPLYAFKVVVTLACVLPASLLSAALAYETLGAAIANSGAPLLLRALAGALCTAALCMLVFAVAVAAVEAIPTSTGYHSADDVLVNAWRVGYSVPRLRALFETSAQRRRQVCQRHADSTASPSQPAQFPQLQSSQPPQLPPPPSAYREPRITWILCSTLGASGGMLPYALLSLTQMPGAWREADNDGAASLATARVMALIGVGALVVLLSGPALCCAGSYAWYGTCMSPLDFEEAPQGLSRRELLLFLLGKAFVAPPASAVPSYVPPARADSGAAALTRSTSAGIGRLEAGGRGISRGVSIGADSDLKDKYS